MTNLWFAHESGELFNRGGMLYASRPGGVYAVYLWEPVYPRDLAQESDQLLGHYGSSAGGIGHLLLGNGLRLSPSLEQWTNERNIPAADLRPWTPCLISIDGAYQLALVHDFDDARVYATTWASQHLTVLTPTTDPPPALLHHDDLTVTSRD